MPATSYAEAIRPFVTDYAEHWDMAPLQGLGGLATEALAHPDTVLDFDELRAIAPPGLDTGLHRVRKNGQPGSQKDFDALLLSSQEHEKDLVQMMAERAMGEHLRVEIHPILDDSVVADFETMHPLQWPALSMVLSDRFMAPDQRFDPQSSRIRRVLYPFVAPLDNQLLEGWTLELDDFEMPISAAGYYHIKLSD